MIWGYTRILGYLHICSLLGNVLVVNTHEWSNCVNGVWIRAGYPILICDKGSMDVLPSSVCWFLNPPTYETTISNH
jgi:hypothetical protein